VYLPLLFSALALIICTVSILLLRSFVKRRTSREWMLTEIREEVNQLVKSIDETADRDITLIKERENALKNLLGDIDKRLKLYIREMEKRREAEETYSALSASGNQAAPAAGEMTPPGDGTYVDLGKLRYRLKKQEASQGETSAAAAATAVAGTTPGAARGTNFGAAATAAGAAKTAAAAPAGIPVPPEPAPATSAPAAAHAAAALKTAAGAAAFTSASPVNAPSLNDQIRQLLKAGYGTEQIASRLGLSISEVEFKAALLERQG